MTPSKTIAPLGFRPPRSVVDGAWLTDELAASRAGEVACAERTLFDELAGGKKAQDRLVLFGAGNLGRRTLAGLRTEGVEPLAFADNSPALAGRHVDGLEVLTPDEAVHRRADATFVVTIWTPLARPAHPDAVAQLSRLGGRAPLAFVPLYWKYPERFLPYYCLALPHRLFEAADEVKQAYTCLDDEPSRHEFLVQLSCLLSDMTTLEIPRSRDVDWYFPRDLVRLGQDEVFVDCGAYDGDSLLHFVAVTEGQFCGAWAFEPDPVASARLAATVATLPSDVRARVVVQPKAAAATNGILGFSGGATPESRLAADGELGVEAVRLDDALQGVTPTFIKMDIEGAEFDALAGAREVIARARPVLAICVYHLQEDIHRIPNRLATMCPRYRFYLRRLEGDLVCFAVPEERSIGRGRSRAT